MESPNATQRSLRKDYTSLTLSLHYFPPCFFRLIVVKWSYKSGILKQLKCTLPFLCWFWMACRTVEEFICIFCLVVFHFFLFACLLLNEALRIKCLKDCRHFTWVVWLFKDTPQYTTSWNAAQPAVRCVRSILRLRQKKKKKTYNPTMLCKWNKSLVFCWAFIMSPRSNIAQTIVKLFYNLQRHNCLYERDK